MSKIPRSNINVGTPVSFCTPSVKSMNFAASTPLEPPKITSVKNVNKLKFSPNDGSSTISSKAESTSGVCLPLKSVENKTLKRSAPMLQQTIKKQPRIVNKPTTSAAKVALDFKTQYNDLFKKYEDLNAKYSSSLTDNESIVAELNDTRKNLEDSRFENNNLLKQNEELMCKVEKYKLDVSNIQNRVEDDKKMISELENSLTETKCEYNEIAKDRDTLLTRLSDVDKQLCLKIMEYNSLKSMLNVETEKNINLLDNLSSCKSEITYLKIQRDHFEEKNNENKNTIFKLEKENETLNDRMKIKEEQLSRLISELEEKNIIYEKLLKSYQIEKCKCKDMISTIDRFQSEITSMNEQLMNKTRRIEMLESQNNRQFIEINNEKQRNEELEKRVEFMFENEKSLRNDIQDLKGHIRVFCRIRPSLNEEQSKSILSIEILDSSTMEIDKTVLNTTSNLSKKTKNAFTFDGIFSQTANQIEVFREVSSLVQSAMDGYNVCIFAYGQTGSGKTYTMEGDLHESSSGITPRAIDLIFSRIPELNKIGWEFTLKASFIEIYNETIYDLLNTNKDQEDHAIKMVDSKSADIYVSNLKEENVTNENDLMKLLLISQKNRKTAATLCNERSSRSHSITQIKFCACHMRKKEKYVSTLNLVDLAGSESGKTSQRIDETKYINKSLSELSKVILALKLKQSHVPYRNSKLTHLLMPSLGGNSKTLMFVNISQLDDQYQETLNSLRFATNVSTCKTAVAKKNVTNF